MKTHHKEGFTLLEMSIVLLIISLLIGGVAISRSLIRASEIRGALNELQRYTQSISNFRDKYLALPGDFSTATSLWGTATSCPNGSSTTTETCNGDGNGRISDQTVGTFYEEFRAWQHLSNANLIDATVTGVTGSGSSHDRNVGSNIPASTLNGAGWGLTSYTVNDVLNASAPLDGNIPYVTGDVPPSVVLWFGGNSNNSTSNRQAGVLTVEEASEIDTKVDDGLANTGKVVAQKNAASPLCMDVANSYDFTVTDRSCALVFKLGF